MLLMNKSFLWVALSAAFSLWVGYEFGLAESLTYLLCYSTEMALSLDNLLMFYIIFKYFNLNKEQQKTALNIGIVSAIILRAIMIFSGSILVHKYEWLSYFFAAFLFYSAWKILFLSDYGNQEPKKLISFIKKLIPTLSVMALAIAVIEITDIVFAMDSIPASLGITKNPLIIWSANIFAIIGLRSLYFLMLNMIERFVYLEKIIACILICTGIKFIIGG